MQNRLKQLAGVLILLLMAVQLLAAPVTVMAQTPAPAATDATGYNGNVGGVTIEPDDILNAINSPTPNLANTTAYVMVTITYMLTSTVDPTMLVTQEQLNQSAINGKPIARQGLIGNTSRLISGLIENQPASVGEYTAMIARQSRFAPQHAYAQGFGVGFGALTPILGTWAAFRNVAYFLLTVMFMVTGLLIIFRQKVSGNVAVTVQNALPRLVITLITITFSYAIAGLVVDLMFWSIYFIIFIFTPLFDNGEIHFDRYLLDIRDAGFISEVTDRLANDSTLTPTKFALQNNIFTISFNIFTGGGGYLAAKAIAQMVETAIKSLPLLGEVYSVIDAVDIFGLLDYSVQMIFELIFGIAILIQVFRTFFQLLMSYAGFVINVVLSPFILLTGALPGKNGVFTKWVKNLIAGLAPFVVVIFMAFMSLILLGINTIDGVGYAQVDPGVGLQLPLIRNDSVGTEGAAIGILAIGFIMLMPEAVGMVKKQFGGGGPFDEFKDKAFKNFMSGWEGNKYVPGAKKMVGPAVGGAALGAGASVAGGTYGGGKLGEAAARKMGGGERAQKIGRWTGRALGGAGGAVISPVAGGLGFAGGAGAAVGINAGRPVMKFGKQAVKYASGASESLGIARDIMNEGNAIKRYVEIMRGNSASSSTPDDATKSAPRKKRRPT